MVRLSKIYTKTGDRGATTLGDGSGVAKHDPRVEAYGEVDEANASVGLAISSIHGKDQVQSAIREELVRIQHDLFDVGADLCVPISIPEVQGERLRVSDPQIKRLERRIDHFNKDLAPLDSFVLPAGTELAARLHVARTVVRRAERSVAVLIDQEQTRVNPLTLIYLNRLSDLLFVFARVANDCGKSDVRWIPGANREA